MDNFRDSYFKIDWDLSQKRLKGTFWGKQYDTGRGFEVTVINGGQVLTATTEVLRLKWEKSDNTAGYVRATVVNGKFIIENIDQMFTVQGSVRADFELSVAGETLASITFYVSVEKAVAVGAIESSSEFTALQAAIAAADNVQAQVDAVVANATVDSEVILARGTEPTLGARLDATDAQLADIEQDKAEKTDVGLLSGLLTTAKTSIVNAINELFNNKANKVQEDWIIPTLVDGTTGTARYRKNSIGQLEIVINVSTVSTPGAVLNLFQLTSRYRPSVELSFSAATWAVNPPSFSKIDITTFGNVRLYPIATNTRAVLNAVVNL